MICPNCKAKISEHSKFCIYCGTEMILEQEKTEQSLDNDDSLVQRKSVKSHKPINKKILIIVSLIIILLILILIFGGMLSSKKSLFIEGLEQKINAEKRVENISPDSEVPLSLQYTNVIANAVDFTLIDINYVDNQALVSFSYVDVMNLADEFDDSDVDAESFYKYCLREVEGGNAIRKTEEIMLSFVISKENGEKVCIIENTPELANVLTGGIYKELMNLLEEFE